jgi:3-dehydroquinate dehydratase/shikimate dehydrogenase
VSWAPRSAEEINARRAAVVPDADLVELRLDALDPAPSPAEIPALLAGLGLPTIATCRSHDEGGGWRGSEDERLAILQACLEAGADYVDIELDAGACSRIVAEHPTRCVVSRHWEGTPSTAELEAAVRRLVALRPAVGKFVVTPGNPADAIDVLRAGGRLRREGIASCCFALGSAGAASRLLAAARGDAWTYARSPAGDETAAGQWSARRLRDELRLPEWTAGQQLYGVVGDPVRQSLSPAIFNAAFVAEGRRAAYLPLPGGEFDAALRLAGAADVRGLSVTMPFKLEAFERASAATPAAVRAGAANTLRATDSGWEAHNTDGEGVIVALRSAVEPAGARVAVLGAGGAARAAAASLVDVGATVVLCARRPARAAAEANAVGCEHADLADFSRVGADIVVNATPVGMEATAGTPVPTTDLKGSEVVLDMIYRPFQTELLREAGARGCVVIPGLRMFLAQAEAQYRWWFDASAPAGTMEAAARQHMGDDVEMNGSHAGTRGRGDRP